MRNVEKVGVVGLGLLGRGIAACFLGHGFHVVGMARNEQRHAEARAHIADMIHELVRHDVCPKATGESWSARYIATSTFEDFRDCSFVVESVIEDPEVKWQVLDSLENVLSPCTVIASNSSAIPISQLQQHLKHPERLIGMHWAEPAHATRFLEIVCGARTSEEAVRVVRDLAGRLGKDPSVCQKEIAGFIANRIGYAMYREALHLLEAGIADAETIDRSVRNAFGLWATVCGPFRWMDMTGGPELYLKAMRHVLPTLNNATEPAPVLKALAASGARGTLNGRGFFTYTPEEARHWEELYRRHAWRVSQMQNDYFSLKNGRQEI